MNELLHNLAFRQLRTKLRAITNPPEPVQQKTRGLMVPLDRYMTSRSKTDSEASNQKSGFKHSVWKELNDTVGYIFEEGRVFPCTEYTQLVNSIIPVKDLLANQCISPRHLRHQVVYY